MMLACLMNNYPENGLELYKKFDYWKCKELIEISNDGRINPGDRLQEDQNNLFNSFLDKNCNKKMNWMYLDTEYNLKQIQKHSYDQLSS